MSQYRHALVNSKVPCKTVLCKLQPDLVHLHKEVSIVGELVDVWPGGEKQLLVAILRVYTTEACTRAMLNLKPPDSKIVHQAFTLVFGRLACLRNIWRETVTTLNTIDSYTHQKVVSAMDSLSAPTPRVRSSKHTDKTWPHNIHCNDGQSEWVIKVNAQPVLKHTMFAQRAQAVSAKPSDRDGCLPLHMPSRETM